MVWKLWWFEYISKKDHLINQLISHRGVCRTASATPGLLINCIACYSTKSNHQVLAYTQECCRVSSTYSKSIEIFLDDICLRIQHIISVEGGMITGCRISLTALNLKKLDSNMTYFDFAIKFNTNYQRFVSAEMYSLVYICISRRRHL